MSAVGALSVGDVFGFAALFLTALAALLMLLRSRLLKMTRNLNLVRSLHVAVSAMAGLFLVLHITSLYLPPSSTGILLGYLAVGVSAVLWLTGTAFLTKVRDSLFFHGVLSGVFIPLALMHAAIASPNIGIDLGRLLVAGAAGVVIANATLHLRRAVSSRPGRQP
jgi:hypothetical protein